MLIIKIKHNFMDIIKTFNEMSALYIKKKLPKKIILSGPNGIGKSTFSYHLINYIFSLDEKNNYDLKNLKINEINRSFNLVKSNSHPNFSFNRSR